MANSNMLTTREAAHKKDTQLRVWNVTKISAMFLIMVVIAIFLLFPYVFMVNKSLMTQTMVIDSKVPFFPDFTNLQFVNYVTLFTQSLNGINFGSALGYTFIVIIWNIIFIPLSASMAAFAFSKLHWKGKNIVFAAMMLTIMLPGVATQIPLYVMYSKIGWINTLWPFMIPNLFGGGALYIFLIRQYMLGIPNELIDAAKVDGCSIPRIYLQIVLPNCKTILIYIMVQVFFNFWGDYYGPLVYLTSSDAPITFAYALFKASTEGNSAQYYAHIRMAGGVFMTLFPALIFTIFQNQLTDGTLTSGLKG